MKFLLFIFLGTYGPCLFASDIDHVDIVTPISYERKTGATQSLESSTEIWLGNLVGAADIAPKIKESIAPYRKDLAEYFTRPGELDQLLNSLLDEANHTIVKGKLTDEKAIQVNRFFGNKLIGKIADKILENQGVSNPDRRSIWVSKILAPFNKCIDKATNALYSADHCMTALTTSLVPSAGVGIVYELSRANLSRSMPEAAANKFNANQAELYRECIKGTNANTDKVKTCSLNAMKAGMLQVSEASLAETINSTATSKAIGNSIKSKVWPNYTKCVQEVGSNPANKDYTSQFLSCVDGLVQSTGIQLVTDKISNTGAIKEQFSKSELSKLAADKAEQFKICSNRLITENIRKNGMLDVDSCKDQISTDVTYQVILRMFKQNAEKQFPEKSELSEASFKIGKEALEKCWAKKLDQVAIDKCARTSIITFAKQIATLKLDLAIPPEIESKDKIKNSGLEIFRACLEKKLPTNITESSETTSIISNCSDSVSKTAALAIAEEEVRLSVKDSMTTNETNQLIQTVVKDQFAKCLGNNLSDANIAICSDNIKITIAGKLVESNINQNLVDRPSLSLAQTRSDLKTEIMDNFKKCLATSLQKDGCTDELKKEADRKIVLAFGKIETSVQLNTPKPPSKLIPIQDEFTECTKTKSTGVELDSKLDDCNKNFSIEFARNLGLIKLDFLLGNALGKTTIKEQQSLYSNITSSYNKCLDDLYKYKMADKLTEKISTCTDALQSRALGLVRQNLSDWMATDEKDAASTEVKNEYAALLPCLSSLLPAAPYSQSLQSNVDSALKPVAILLAQFIDYSPENAKSNLNDIIAKLSENIKANGGSDKAKSDLIDLLYKNGALDQFIKAMVRGKVKDAFATLSDKDLPKSVRDQLLTRENFDTIFGTPEGKSIKDYILENMLKPILIKGVDISSPLMVDSFAQVNGKVVKMLVGSPRFGDIIIKEGVQKQIDNLGGFTRFFAKMIYGNDSLNWDKVRMTGDGKKAEEYIRQNVLMPKFQETPVSPEEEKRIAKEAESLVNEAVKKYSESKK